MSTTTRRRRPRAITSLVASATAAALVGAGIVGLGTAPALAAAPLSTAMSAQAAPSLTGIGTSSSSGQVSVSFFGSDLPAGEILSVKEGNTPLQWTTGRPATVSDTYTVPSTGTLNAKVVFAAGIKSAGELTLTVTGDHADPLGTSQDVSLTVQPYVSFGAGTTQVSAGTLTISNLPANAAIDSVALGGKNLAGHLTASATGSATTPYSLTKVPLGIHPLVITQTAPASVAYRQTQKVSPDPTPFNEDLYHVLSNGAGFAQGLYQSAYSTSEDALFVTSAAGSDGFLYRVNPRTLEVVKTVQAPFVSGTSGPRHSPLSIAVDDVNKTVWVSNTFTDSVAVYDAKTLTLRKQHPKSTIPHARDVAYDPASNRVFASSPSGGSNGGGVIYAFEAADNDHDGVPFEKIGEVALDSRAGFSPMSLDISDGKLASPNLRGGDVVIVDTATLTPSFLDVPGLETDGRGGSGIAFDTDAKRLFIATQNGDNVVIANASNGSVLANVPTGAQALNVAWDAVRQRAYVTNFGSTHLTVLDKDGTKIANLPIARSNHVTVDDKGSAYVVDKNSGNKVWKISPKIATQPTSVLGTDVSDPTGSGTTAKPDTTPLSVTVAHGEPIHLEGSGFFHPDDSGSTIAIKLDSAAAQPAAGPVTNPVNGQPLKGAYAIAQADNQGAWSIDLPFPTAKNVNDASFAWGVGDTHHLRLLTGSLKPGDAGRTIAIKVKVTGQPLKTGTPTITGAAKVDRTLTALPGTWTAGTAFTYQWNRDGQPIAGATSSTYVVTTADAGHPLTVTVNGSSAGHTDASATSAPVTAGDGTLLAGTPKITGTAQVDETLTATPGTWAPGVSTTVQWQRNGVAIVGATGTTYVPVPTDVGATLSVVVTGLLPGHGTAHGTSAQTDSVAKGVLVTAKPRIKGKAKVGKKLTVKTAGWSKGVTHRYVWKANGKVIKRTKARRLKLSKRLQGKKITVTVKATKPGYVTAKRTSAKTKRVKAPRKKGARKG